MIILLQGMTLGFSASVSPGPFQAYLLTQTMRLGGLRALPLAAVPLLSDGPIVAITLLLLSQTPAWLVRGLELAGGVFLLYLAWAALQAARRAADVVAPAESAPRLSLVQGTLMNLLNPNPWIFWSMIGGPLVLAAWSQSAGAALTFLAGFYTTLIGGTAAFILLFAAAHRLDRRVITALNLISAVALAVFGLIQLYRGTTGA